MVSKTIEETKPKLTPNQVLRERNRRLLLVLANNMHRNGYVFTKTNALVFLDRAKDQIPQDIMQTYLYAVKTMK